MHDMNIFKSRDVKTPERGTPGSAGIDFFVPERQGATITPKGSANIPSGIHVKIPKGHVLIAFNKSGVALKKDLIVGACVIDEDYQGEIHLHVMNIGRSPQFIGPGDKLVQFVLLPVVYSKVEDLGSLEALYGGHITERGKGGFGSTNKV